MAKICRASILFLTLAVALVIWHGNKSAIEIKDFIVQIVYALIFGLSGIRLLFQDRMVIRKDPLIILVIIYGILMTGAYLLNTSRCSLNYKALIPQLCGVMTFIWVILYFDKTDIEKLIRVALMGAVIASVYGILQYFRLDPLHWEKFETRSVLRVASFFGNKNYFAIYLLLMIPLGGYIALTSPQKHHIFIGGFSTLLMVTAMALSNSKGAFISFLISALLFAALFLLKRGKLVFNSLKSGIFLFAIPFALLLAIVFLSKDIQKDYAKRFRYFDYYAMQRIVWYQAAAEVIEREPFWGVGPGNFAISYSQNETYKVKTTNPNSVLNHVHNDFLEIWAEYGLPTLLAYLGVLLLFLHKWIRAFRQADTRIHQVRLILILCALSGYVLYSTLTVAGRYMSSVFYFWLVMGIGHLCIRDDEADGDPLISVSNTLRGNRKISAFIIVMMILIFGIACKKILANYISDVYICRAYGFAVRARNDKALKYLDSAIELQPASVEAYYQRGFVHFSKKQTDQAIADYERVSQMAPHYVNVDFNLASCFYREKDWKNAIRMASISHRLFPDYLAGMMTLAYAHHYNGQHQKSLSYCELILKRYKGHKPALQLRQKLEEILNKKEENYGSSSEGSNFGVDGGGRLPDGCLCRCGSPGSGRCGPLI